MIDNNHAGPVEYAILALLTGHALLMRSYLRRWRARLSRRAFTSLLVVLAVFYGMTGIMVWIVMTGRLFRAADIPLDVVIAITSTGYLWIVFSSFAIFLQQIGRFVLARTPAPHVPTRRRWLQLAGSTVFAAPIAAAGYGTFIERKDYRVNELDFPVPNLHPDFDGFRIVQVSDLHVSPFLSPQDAARAVAMANELKPDLAVFSGDLITEYGDPLDDALRELARFQGDYGTLASMGNHEQYVGCADYVAEQTARAGMIFLRNAATRIHRGNGTLNIAGVDYQRMGDGSTYLPGAEQLVVPGLANILLSHNPDVFPTAVERGFQAVLSGHTHGGQVNVEILHHNINPARFRTPYTSGLYRLGEGAQASTCFVTNGVGTLGVPIRLGAPPEVVLLRLRRA